jgi:transcription elongation factor Elf1
MKLEITLKETDKKEYTDHNGNIFSLDKLLPCPFCGSDVDIEFVGNSRSKKGRKAIIKCPDCRATMTNTTIRYSIEWVAKISVEYWNKRIK